MANVIPTITPIGNGCKVRWGPIQGGDNCEPVSVQQFRDKCATVEGTATTFALQGRNQDGETLRTLEDTDGTAITVAGIYQIKENPSSIKPLLTTGANVFVTLECRK
jgi:hypothetical protein